MGAILGLGVTPVPHAATATVLYAHELALVPITTPAYSAERKLFAVSGTLGSTPVAASVESLSDSITCGADGVPLKS